MAARPFTAMTALLYGATSGIALEIAAQLAEAGVPRLVLVGRDAGRGAAAIATVVARAPGAVVMFVTGDASLGATVAQATDTACALGGIDLLVNAVPGNSAPRPFTQLDPAQFASLIRLHLDSVLLATHAALPRMIAAGGGVVITIASDAAKIPTPGESVHGALMAALVMFSRTLALENARHAVRVHALTPSLVDDTHSAERMMAEPFSARLFGRARERAALGLPTPADVAAAALYLASPLAARVTGQVLTINGGLAIA
jgi:NAD(P)-dependent dehydrogenase (short-subunit alcohol dehydrogenase family)